MGRQSNTLPHPNIDDAAIGGTPDCPFPAKGDARKKWDELVPLLSAAGSITKLDGDALKRYCLVWARLEKSERALAREGAVKKGKGKPGKSGGRGDYMNVHLFVANKCIDQLESIGKLLGIDRLSRSRMGVEPPKSGRGGVLMRDRNDGPPPPNEATA